MLTVVRFTALLAACPSRILRQNEASGDAREGKSVETQMNATLRRGTREAINREKPGKTGIMIFGAGLGEGFGAAFAVAVMLGALWLLLSGYV